MDRKETLIMLHYQILGSCQTDTDTMPIFYLYFFIMLLEKSAQTQLFRTDRQTRGFIESLSVEKSNFHKYYKKKVGILLIVRL